MSDEIPTDQTLKDLTKKAVLEFLSADDFDEGLANKADVGSDWLLVQAERELAEAKEISQKVRTKLQRWGLLPGEGKTVH